MAAGDVEIEGESGAPKCKVVAYSRHEPGLEPIWLETKDTH
jgi:hypothetical protein